MTRDVAMAHLDTYLQQVRRHLKGLSEAEVREVLLELRAHVLDRVEGQMTPRAVEAALTALGGPREVARLNVTERVAAVMEKDRSFFGVLAAVVRLAGLSVVGVITFFVSLIGYGLALACLAVAVWKPFDPTHVGLWRTPAPEGGYSFMLGGMDKIPPSHEMLGWGVIPFSLVLAGLFGWLTWRFGVFAVRLMAVTRRRRPGALMAA